MKRKKYSKLRKNNIKQQLWMIFSVVVLVGLFVVVNEHWVKNNNPNLYQIIDKLMDYCFAPIIVGLVFVNLSYYNSELERIESSSNK